jgi:phage terminase small subunit
MLTDRQKRFVDLYAGNATEAARLAGYSVKTADKIASQLMDKPEIISAIRARENERSAETIMTREQRQIFWTSIARDTSQRIGDRLRASELLAKSEGDFIERREVTGANGEALIPNTPPITISYEFVKTFQRADGTNINPDEHPEEYAEALRNDFLKDHRERTE